MATGGSEAILEVRSRVLELLNPGRQDTPPLVFLEALLAEHPHSLQALAHLVSRDPDGEVRKWAMALLATPRQDTSASQALKRRVKKEATPLLLAAFEDPDVPDAHKVYVGPLLELLGTRISRGRYVAAFRDFQEALERFQTKDLAAIPDDGEVLQDMLIQMKLIRERARPSAGALRVAIEFGLHLACHNPVVGAPFLAVTGAIAAESPRHRPEAEVALRAVAALRTPRAAWLLSELARWPAADAWARPLADDLTASGVAPEAPPAPPFHRALVSTVDGSGSRSLALFFQARNKEDLDALVLILNDERGIKDAWCAYGDGDGLELRLNAEARAFATAPVREPLARELVSDALAVHLKEAFPVPGQLLLFRPWLGPEPSEPRARAPQLGPYGLTDLPRGGDLAAGSARLFEDPIFGSLWFSGDEAYEFFRTAPRVREGRRRQLVEAFLHGPAKLERERLLRRMALNLETEALGGRSAKPMNRLAARTWLALSERLTPFAEVPYVRKLAQHAAEMISENVARGFRNQREVNEAGPF